MDSEYEWREIYRSVGIRPTNRDVLSVADIDDSDCRQVLCFFPPMNAQYRIDRIDSSTAKIFAYFPKKNNQQV